jgi:hypothetical protein
VVLGGGVHPDGTLPRVARARVERAVELFECGIAPRIILSGRCGLTAPDAVLTEPPRWPPAPPGSACRVARC